MKTFLACIFLSCLVACIEPPPPNPWKEPARTIDVKIVIGKYDHRDCMQIGGTFIIGDTKDWGNALVGCIEPVK